SQIIRRNKSSRRHLDTEKGGKAKCKKRARVQEEEDGAPHEKRTSTIVNLSSGEKDTMKTVQAIWKGIELGSKKKITQRQAV
ncbi:hypothetical protein ACLOJK_014761, partial [Asimina triloba]